MDVLEAIDEALKRKGLSDAAASKQAVGHPSLIKNLRMPRDGEKRYNWTALEKLAHVLDLELYFGPPRDPAPPPSVLSGQDAQDYVEVPLHEALLAAGAGAHNDDDRVIDRLTFRRDWLAGRGVTPSAARLARVHGDSMLPTLHPGDMVLVDTARRDVPVRRRAPQDARPAPIYALRHDGGAVIKRLERISDRQLLLLSDNPAHPPQLREDADLEATEVIGKVVWWGHTVRE